MPKKRPVAAHRINSAVSLHSNVDSTKAPLRERVAALQATIKAFAERPGFDDKRFFDEAWDNERSRETTGTDVNLPVN